MGTKRCRSMLYGDCRVCANALWVYTYVGHFIGKSRCGSMPSGYSRLWVKVLRVQQKVGYGFVGAYMCWSRHRHICRSRLYEYSKISWVRTYVGKDSMSTASYYGYEHM